MEKQPADPIARMLLSELGLNEQTLAVSGTEEKVRQYLATLLSEDRSMVDTTRLGADWMPREVKLDLRSWSAATLRARREAVPLLGVGGERDILVALKPFEKIDWSELEEDVQSGKVSDVQARRLLEQAAHLTRLLREYEPKAEDGSSHEEMANLAARFLKLAVEQERRLQDICGSMLQTVGEG